MKKRTFILTLILLMLPICVLPILFPNDGPLAGQLQIATLQAALYTLDSPDCTCCAPLWGGGIATTPADLSTVQVGDWATITLLDGSRLVLECAAIIPCIRAGNWLVSWQGVFRAEGDIIIYDKCMAYMLVRL